MDDAHVVGAVQGEGWHVDIKKFTGFGFHLIVADHDSRRRRKGRAGGVFKLLARAQNRLLADNARAADFFCAAQAVGDPPGARF